MYASFFRTAGYADEVSAVGAAWSAGDRAGAVKRVSPRMLDGLGVVGDEAFCRARIAEFAADRPHAAGDRAVRARRRRSRLAPAHAARVSLSRMALSVLGVIPARLASTRLPRKVLREIAGRPLVAWVYAAARRAPDLDDVLVATDAEEVVAVCRASGHPGRA